MTKIVTTVGLLMLMEEGRFLLDEPVARFIPAFAGLDVQRETGGPREALRRPVTIHDLLTHCKRHRLHGLG
jgi:CubicO group peptidase (beta-lactamase class C family)